MNQGTDNTASKLWRVRLERLRHAWEYARQNSPYYSRILSPMQATEHPMEALRKVPICTAKIFERYHEEIRCRKGLPAFMVFTGGSTGKPRVIYGTEEILNHSANAPIYGADTNLGSLILSTGGGHHGDVPIPQGKRGGINIPLRSRANYFWASHLLRAEHQYEGYEKKISCLFLPLPAIKKLVHFLLEEECDLSELGLRWVGSYAWYLSPQWRRLIATVLNAPVVDHYGFTESLGVIAGECPACGMYHYGPDALPEIVDPWTHEPIQSGKGKLLVTSLHPGTRDHLLLRYDPGDLVIAGPFCEFAGDAGFRPCGREAHAVLLDNNLGRHILLVPTDVQELIDLEPLVGRMNEPRFAGVTFSSDDDFPKWRSRLEQKEDQAPVLQIEIELKVSPVLHYVQWQELERKWRGQLLAANTILRQFVERGAVNLRFQPLPPGSLRDQDVIIC